MCMFMIFNMSSLQLICVNLIAYRTQKGDTTFVTHDAILKEFRKKLREKDMDLDFSPSYIAYYKKIFDC